MPAVLQASSGLGPPSLAKPYGFCYSTNTGIDNYTTFNNDNIPIIDEKDLTDISLFKQLYFSGKCVDWQITGEVSIVDRPVVRRAGKKFDLAKEISILFCYGFIFLVYP